MRIVQLLSQTHLTGAEAHAVTLVEGLIAKGHHVVLISDRIHLATRAGFVSRPIHAAKGLFARRREVAWLRDYILKEKIDLVHAHSRAAVRIAYRATRDTPAALVSTIHGRQHFSWGKRLRDHYGERVIAVCEALKNHLVTDFHMRPSRIRVLGNPIDRVTVPFLGHGVSQKGNCYPWLLVTRWTGPKGERAVELLQSVILPLLEKHPGLLFDWAGTPPEIGSAAESVLKTCQDRFPTRFRALGFIDPLEDKFPEYALVLGAGRVALAATGAGIPCFAFGEAETCGVIRTSNLSAALASNFGDISPTTANEPLNLELTRRDLSGFLENERPTEEELNQIAMRVRDRSETAIVVHDVLEIYSSARLIKHHPRPIPVLMYHQVTDAEIETPHRIFVTAATFQKHLQTFRKHGRQTLTFLDLLDFKEGRRPWAEFPKHPLILTFDDGYENNLRLAMPLLKEYGFRAIIYLLADSALAKNTWDEGASPQVPLLTPKQRKELANSGVFEIGSHGFRHQRLPGMTEVEARSELHDSRKQLEAELGVKIPSFAFTYGDIDEHSAEQARRAGYAYALNTDRGGIHLEEDPHAIFRVNVFPEDGPGQILKKASWWYRWRYYWKRGK
jgi:peptidoglycan/xylan/chitin deacetylase (PgdA/CDA1 family)